jgi:hypothetical protein
MSRLIGSKVFGAALVLAGSGLYLVDLTERTHHFAIPAALLMGIGALLTMFGAMSSE